MEEPAKNDETSGFSKRRISSILKAPRRSARFPEPEEQENTVECAKPVEKRRSRRVSFAPANDVLLFSKDEKNASPARSPLQELMAATLPTPQNSVQIAAAEDEVPPIMGMETLLNAPLHASQQRDGVNVGEKDQCGEKTILFTADDECMDMTHSQTVNIASDPLAPQQSVLDGLDPGFKQFLASLCAGSSSVPLQDVPTQSKGQRIEDSVLGLNTQASSSFIGLKPSSKLPPKSEKVQRYQFDAEGDWREQTMRFTANDAAMDVTRSHTLNIDTGFDPQSCQNTDVLRSCGERTVRFTANDAAMDVTQCHTVNIDTGFDPQQPCLNVDVLPNCGEKTVRFTATDADMDVTRSHTVNVATNIELASNKNSDFQLGHGDKTQRFSAIDAAMDVTRSHTVSIDTAFYPQSCQSTDVLRSCGERTVRFAVNDAAMDVTQSHTVNIDTGFDPQQPRLNVDILPTCGDETMRFTASDACMDVTRSHTVNIATNPELASNLNLDLQPTRGVKAQRFSANDAAVDVTRSHSVNIATNLELMSNQKVDAPAAFHLQPCKNVEESPGCGVKTDAVKDVTQSCPGNISSSLVSDSVSCQVSNIMSTQRNLDLPLTVKRTEGDLCRNTLSAAAFHPGFKNSPSKTNDSSVDPLLPKAMTSVAPSPQEDVYRSDYVDHLKAQKSNVNSENEAAGFVQPTTEESKDTVMTDCLQNSVCDMTQAQTGSVFYADELSKCLPSETRQEPELRNETARLSQKLKCSPSAADKEADTLNSQKSRRASLANLQSKLRRLSHMINAAPDVVVTDGCTVPLPQLDQDSDKNSKDKTTCLPKEEPEREIGVENADDKTQVQGPTGAEEPSTAATPFNLKTTQLMSRLSVGGFKPKLPQRNKPDDTKRTVTVNVTSQLSRFDDDFSNINDEVLISCDDMSETMDSRSLQEVTDKMSCFQEDEPLKEFMTDEVFISTSPGQKRPPLDDENITEHEKRVKTSTETTTNTVDMELPSPESKCDGTTTARAMTTQSSDLSNNSQTCEATFESTFKHSMFESQLDDYGSDVQKKLDDGSITMSEFFKLFSIDFVIHNPRQSVLPGRPLSDTGRTSMDLLKDRHINRPKQVVYEADVLNLTEKVEGLKGRMRDLHKPLKLVNRRLWEELRNSSEKELKSFGAKLKEKNNFFRKVAKTQSHELKEVLYSKLVQANLEEQQKLRGVIEKADDMIKSLDDCIHQLETELAEVEERGFESNPGLKMCQEELKKVTGALAANEQKMCELDMQKNQNLLNVSRVKAETRKLKRHIDMLHMISEWKVGKKTDTCTSYMFLYDTMYLYVVFDECNGNDGDKESEHKISEITFKFLLDDETSKCNARLVHKLLSQFTEGESDWVEKYPTSRHVPQLLHDVSLVVSRCRLLGEELRLLNMWGAMRLDILDIRCVGTEVHIVFSSLKKCAKFELHFSVSLINRLYVLQLQSFKNKFGPITIQQIEEIVASFSPGKKLLTKIVKRIHADLLV